MNREIKKFHSQRGVVLFVSLIMLVVIGMLTLSLMGISRIEMRMANNEEARVNGLQMAQSLSDVFVNDPALTPVVGKAGYSICAGTDGCDETVSSGQMPAQEITDAIDDGYLSVKLSRPEQEFRKPPRGSGTGNEFIGAAFHIEATYDGTEDGRGYGKIEEGLLVLIPL